MIYLLSLALAINLECPIITGDRHLREAAKVEGAELLGTLWLVERLVKERLIEVADAERAYEAMRNDRRRLPWSEVAGQIVRLRKSK